MPNPTLSLRCHPDTPCDCLDAIEVGVTPAARGLRLTYTLRGNMVRLRLPPAAPPGPADELWRHTCCEAFVAGEGEAYREFNFSPSGQWAVYHFGAYRHRIANDPPASGPAIAMTRTATGLQLTADIPAALLPAGHLALGLSVVAESDAGAISYWALAHAPCKPDFHRRDTFTLRLEQL